MDNQVLMRGVLKGSGICNITLFPESYLINVSATNKIIYASESQLIFTDIIIIMDEEGDYADNFGVISKCISLATDRVGKLYQLKPIQNQTKPK